MNARQALLDNVETIARAQGKTWDTVLAKLDGGQGLGKSWLSMLRKGHRIKFLSYIDEIATELGVDPSALFVATKGNPLSADGGDAKANSHADEGDVLHLPAGFPDITLFHGMIAIWHRLRTATARERFLDDAGAYAQTVAETGDAPTGTLGKR